MSVSSLFLLVFGGNIAIHPSPGIAIRHDPLAGMPLCVWNDSSVFRKLKGGMQEADQHLFRFPNGSVSNEYHWNGAGRYDADSTWIASDSGYKPGWQAETVYRGTTKLDISYNGTSRITDGDTTTFWWSNPDHPKAPGWFLLDLGTLSPIDSLVLHLGDLRPDSVVIEKWTGASGVYPPPNQQASGWVAVATLPASSRVAATVASFSSRYVGVRPIGSMPQGWKVAEFALWNAGTRVTKHSTDPSLQTAVIAVSAHGASRKKGAVPNWDFEAYMTWMRNYPTSIPMVSVNYGTGTAQEAASWVRYANVTRDYAIRRWQIGNENSGSWEEGGSVSARQYATRFVQYAKAMKAVDPTISVYGPLTPEANWLSDASGDFDGRSWLQGFLEFVDSAEQQDQARYLDGVDVHTYPYYYETTSSAADLLRACDAKGAAFDSLDALVNRTLKTDPDKREILNSEFNSMVGIRSSLQEDVAGASGAGLLFAHYIQRFGNRGAGVFWQLVESGSVGTDGTYGSMGAFNPSIPGSHTTFGYAPNSTFWMLRTLLREWLDTAGTDTILTIDQTPGIRSFAVRNNGRSSVLAFNLGADTATLDLDPSPFPSGDILSWGKGEYGWNGTDAEAYALPNSGPSSRQIPSNWTGSLRIPPFGFAVVRVARSIPAPPRNVSIVVASRKIPTSGTSILSGWSQAPGSRLTKGTWRIGSLTGDLVAGDGAWDGTCEAWTATLDGSRFGEGLNSLVVTTVAATGDSAVDTIAIEIVGPPRTVMKVSDFDGNKKLTTWDSAWINAIDPTVDSTKSDISILTAGGEGSPFIKLSAHIGQPPASIMSYPNFSGLYFPIPLGIENLDTSRNIAGITFDINTTRSGSGQTFLLYAYSNLVTDWNLHFVKLPNTNGAWQHKSFLFDDFKQDPGFGIQLGAMDFETVYAMEFRARGAGEATIALDNVAFLGTRGRSVGLTRANRLQTTLQLRNRILSVNATNDWNLRLIGVDGRTCRRWSGRGPSEISLPRSSGPLWAVLEQPGIRKVLAIPPILR